MNIVALIPARAGSKGVKGKNTKEIAGKPLIQYTLETALACRCITDIVVSTDSVEAKDIAQSCGIHVPFLRPLEISGDKSKPEEYISHYFDYLMKNELDIPSIVIILQPTSPFRSASDVEKCVQLLLDSNCDSVTSICVSPKKYHPNWQFTIKKNGLLTPYEGFAFNHVLPRRQDQDDTYIRNGAVYVFWSKTFIEYKNIYGNKVIPYVMTEDRSINIDDITDWKRAEEYIDCIDNIVQAD